MNPTTPCCVNPTEVLANQAAGGTNLARMGTIVETVGASYHPPGTSRSPIAPTSRH